MLAECTGVESVVEERRWAAKTLRELVTAEWAELAYSDVRVAVKESWGERAFTLVDDGTQWQAPPDWETPRSKAGLLSNPWYGIPPPAWLIVCELSVNLWDHQATIGNVL